MNYDESTSNYQRPKFQNVQLLQWLHGKQQQQHSFRFVDTVAHNINHNLILIFILLTVKFSSEDPVGSLDFLPSGFGTPRNRTPSITTDT